MQKIERLLESEPLVNPGVQINQTKNHTAEKPKKFNSDLRSEQKKIDQPDSKPSETKDIHSPENQSQKQVTNQKAPKNENPEASASKLQKKQSPANHLPTISKSIQKDIIQIKGEVKGKNSNTTIPLINPNQNTSSNFNLSQLQNLNSFIPKIQTNSTPINKKNANKVSNLKNPENTKISEESQINENTKDIQSQKELNTLFADDIKELKISKGKSQNTDKKLNFIINNPQEHALKETKNKLKTPNVSDIQKIYSQIADIKELITNRVSDKINVLINQGETKARLKLYPPELGMLDIEISLKNNRFEASIMTENNVVKDSILSNIQQLKSQIEESGFDQINIDVQVGEFEKNLNDKFYEESNKRDRGNRRNSGFSDQGDDEKTSLNSNIFLPNTPYIGKQLNLLI